MRRLVAVCVVLLSAAAGAEVRPAVGGVKLFPALETSRAAVVASFAAPRELDAQSRAALLTVEVSLRGALERGQTLQIAWEELSPSRPSRFAEGDRVLLALTRLPGASIWRQRIPDAQRRVSTWSVAERGNAFVREPAPGAVQLIEHFLALPAELRGGNPGVAHLVRLAEASQETLAAAALERLDAVPELDAALDPTSAARLVAVLLREPPALGQQALDLVDRHTLASLRAPLRARAAPDGSAPARVYEALARLDEALPAELVATLLERQDSALHRAVGARYAAESDADGLARLLRLDPAPEVRAAALTRLVELHGVAELDRVLYALEDPETSVRTRAMLVIAALGDEAVPGLRKVVEAGNPEAARTAVGALRGTGPAGVKVLQEVAADHPDESLRTLARVALGGHIGHRD